MKIISLAEEVAAEWGVELSGRKIFQFRIQLSATTIQEFFPLFLANQAPACTTYFGLFCDVCIGALVGSWLSPRIRSPTRAGEFCVKTDESCII